MAERPPEQPADDAQDETQGGSDGVRGGAGPEKKPDLRFTSIEQGGVRVDRDLSSSGHLARGSRTNMSNMRFSVRAQPRDELDPELQALRPKEPVARPKVDTPPPAPEPAAPAAPPAAVASPEPPAAAAPATPAPVAEGGGGFIAAIKRLFS